MYAIVILKDKYFNFTYASTRFGAYGEPTDYPIIVCQSWREGFEEAKKQNYTRILFCHSGTVFKNINEFFKRLDNYPHQGLIGHIIDPLVKDEFFSLHPQCFLLDIDKFSSDCFDDGEFETYGIVRSDKNIHDNYTPLWISPNKTKIKKYQNKFGQKLIGTQLNNGRMVSNWHQKLRDNKVYLYRPEIHKQWVDLQQKYTDLAETQLWITNNQKLFFSDTNHLISPASGLYWIMSAATQSLDKITLIDISKNQIELAQALISQWNGTNYSEFVFNFVKKKKLTHLQFEKPLLPLEQLQLQKKEHFCRRVDELFQRQLSNLNLTQNEFQERWNNIKNISIDIINDNIVSQINSGSVKIDPTSTIWISNILDYKYTWIKSTAEEIDQFNDILKSSGARILL
jgi:hypothetical protein